MKLALKIKKTEKDIFFGYSLKQSQCDYYTRVLNLHQNNSKYFCSTIQRLSGNIKNFFTIWCH